MIIYILDIYQNQRITITNNKKIKKTQDGIWPVYLIVIQYNPIN